MVGYFLFTKYVCRSNVSRRLTQRQRCGNLLKESASNALVLRHATDATSTLRATGLRYTNGGHNNLYIKVLLCNKVLSGSVSNQ